MSYRPPIVNLTWQKEIAIPTGFTSGQTSLVPVPDLNKTAIFLGGLRYSGTVNTPVLSGPDSPIIETSGTNTVRATLVRALASTVFITCWIVEFKPSVVKRVQQVTITLSNNQQSNQATIDPPVDPGKTIILPGWWRRQNAANGSGPAIVELTNSSTVTAKLAAPLATGFDLMVNCFVVEFF